MGESLSPKDKTTRTAKRKRRLRSSNKYLKPGALAQMPYSKAPAAANFYTDLGKKMVALVDADGADDPAVLENKFIDKSPTIVFPVRYGRGLSVDNTSKNLSPTGSRVSPFCRTVGVLKLNNLLKTPETPCAEDPESKSRLESMPMDLLVKILCHLHHDQIRAVFHVSQRIRNAVIQARQYHFNYTTPDLTRQQMLRMRTPCPNDHWPFMSGAFSAR